MVVVDTAVMTDPARLAAVHRGRRMLPTLPMPLDAIARLAACLLDAPAGVITLTDEDQQHVAGSFGVPATLAGGASLAYSVCKYVVSADAPVRVADMAADDDPQLRDHPLCSEYGVRAFLGVPLRDAGDRPLGSLTVLDTDARAWTDAQLSTVLEVAELIGPLPATDTAPAGIDPGVVLDTMAEAVVALDPDGRVAGWNRAAQDMFGHTAQQATGRPLGELLRAVYDAGSARLRHRDGRTVYADVRFTATHAFFTDTTRHITAAIDAADALAGDLAQALAGAEADLEAQRGFVTTLLDTLHEGVLAFDRTGSPVVVNRALREVCGVPAGCSPAEALESALGQLRHLDDTVMGLDDSAIGRAMLGQTVRDCDAVLIMPGRPDRYLQADARPIRDRDGRPAGAVATVRDTTERHRTARFRACELAVATVLNRADSITAAAPVALTALARALDWPHAALWLTRSAGASLGLFSEYAAPGYPVAGLLPPEIPRGDAGVIGQVWATGRSAWVPDVTTSAGMSGPPLRDFVEACHEQDLSCLSAVPIRDGARVVGVLSCVAATAESDEFLITGLLDITATLLGHFLIRTGWPV